MRGAAAKAIFLSLTVFIKKVYTTFSLYIIFSLADLFFSYNPFYRVLLNMVRGHPAGGSIRITKGDTSYSCRAKPLRSHTSYRDPSYYYNPNISKRKQKSEKEDRKEQRKLVRVYKKVLAAQSKGETSKNENLWDFENSLPPKIIRDLTREDIDRIASTRKKRSDAGKKRGKRPAKPGARKRKRTSDAPFEPALKKTRRGVSYEKEEEDGDDDGDLGFLSSIMSDTQSVKKERKKKRRELMPIAEAFSAQSKPNPYGPKIRRSSVGPSMGVKTTPKKRSTTPRTTRKTTSAASRRKDARDSHVERIRKARVKSEILKNG